ncbi:MULTISPECIES: hypothetical protein [Deefgea]|uniref:Uncharacterized protein n=1 Tax=Deefgea piscis TaxID=2739061 RepID=A0A6M8SX02_9NEIS|nr:MULTISPECIES: hypothetical protein [Deefgea]MBM5575524.1 hypothetical protein [Deefgea sp. CFH1-16]QKJ67780.1 hypothetical protein HQN60_14210 [Deefgea piscis]
MRELFLDYIMPFLVLSGLLGGLVYLACSHALYTYLKENYSDALPPRLELYMHDAEAMGGFLDGIRYAAKTGNWKRIESNTWRRLFICNHALGYFVVFCCAALCAAFLFWPKS